MYFEVTRGESMRYIGFGACLIMVFSGLTLAVATTEVSLAESTVVSGDLAKGKEVFKVCATCHSLNVGETKIGPTLHGIFGRKSGSVEGFQYSSAMKGKNIVWDEETLDQYVKNPTVFVPGARMLTGGVADDEKRRDLILYLKEAAK